jgi:Sulfotransferase family/Sulfotransferase domain
MVQSAFGPNFFIVGAPRCGTTFLYETLRRHPDVYMPERKEPGHFCPDLDTGSGADSVFFVRERETYLGLFRGGAGCRLRGEATTWYLYSPAAPGLIHAYAPEARIVAILRDPVDMMASLYRWRRIDGAESLDTFEAALAAEEGRRSGRGLPPKARLLAAYQYRDAAHFGRQVGRYLDVFRPDQVRVLILEDLRGDGEAEVIRGLCEFLGLDPDLLPAPPTEPVNAAYAPRIGRLAQLYYAPALVHAVRRVVPRPVYRPIRRAADRLNNQSAPRETMDPALRARLRSELDDDVRHLGRLLDRDLSEVWP